MTNPVITLMQFRPMVDTAISPPPPPPPLPVVDCDEIGRTSRAYASAHYRTRIHDVRLMSGEKRCLVADFNGAVSKIRTIASVKWRCDGTGVAIMANARIEANSRAAAVDVTAGYPGTAAVRCEATLDNGEVYIQPFRVAVSADVMFVNVAVAGPIELTATTS